MPDIDLAGPGAARKLTGYLARPTGEGPWPGVVLVHEAFGLDPVQRGLADTMAGLGYLTLAVDLFSNGGARRCLVATFRSLFTGRGPAVDDIATGREYLRASAGCTGKVGIIGFCMGGGFALLTAPDFDASAPNYGFLPRDGSVLRQACPIVASYGGKDVTLRGVAAKLEATLTEAGVPHDVKEYPGAGHSFLNGGENGPALLRPLLRVAGMGPEPVAAADAWARIDAFFGEHLRA
ncbi:MAG: dienelactone hydrolase family protein [Pseudonocardia sp.]|nr:dienelactone hydrolase family protein [Pseudonocardia sp.]